MSIVQPDLDGARVLDLFAGSGALGIEALSRGAREVVFVEKAARSIATLRANLTGLAAGPEAVVHTGDALRLPGVVRHPNSFPHPNVDSGPLARA